MSSNINKTGINVLYLGMESDILLPMLIEPNFDRIISYGSHDLCYIPDKMVKCEDNTILEFNNSRGNRDATENDVKIKYELIKEILLRGKESHFYLEERNRDIFYIPKDCKNCESRQLLGPIELIEEVDTNDMEYILRFSYLGKIRELIILEGSFQDVWNHQINNISHIIGAGAFSFEYLIDFEGMCFTKDEKKHFRKMFEERTNNEFKFTSQTSIDKINKGEENVFYRRECGGMVEKLITKNIKKEDEWYNFNVISDEYKLSPFFEKDLQKYQPMRRRFNDSFNDLVVKKFVIPSMIASIT